MYIIYIYIYVYIYIYISCPKLDYKSASSYNDS